MSFVAAGAKALWACGGDYQESGVDGGAQTDAPPSIDAGPPRDERCADPQSACLVIPSSWAGPYALVISEDGDAGCEGARPNEVVAKYGDLDAGPASCSCGCSIPQRCNYQYTINSGNTCDALDRESRGSSCVSSAGAATYSARARVLGDAGQTCRGEVTTTRPGVPAAPNVRVCSAAVAAGREGCPAGEVCASRGVKNCILAVGALPCPVEFPERHLVYGTVVDGRTCTGACGCAVTAQPKCIGPSVGIGTLGGLCGDAATPITLDTCVHASNSMALRFGGVADGGTCTGSGDATASGELEQKDPSTICCLAP